MDHCVPVEVAELLRRKGHEAWTAFEAHLQTAGDDDLNIYADAKDAILVTVNKDCAAIARRLQAASVVYLRVRERDAVQAMDRAEAWLQAKPTARRAGLACPQASRHHRDETAPVVAKGHGSGGGRDREILEHAVHTIAEQAAKADDLVDDAIEVGPGRSLEEARVARIPRERAVARCMRRGLVG